ncbi:MAG: Gfo/Idh/MocA family protein, partial [Luteolibacter sp.]
PDVEIVGLCDVNQAALDAASSDYPNAFTCKDYREAFKLRSDQFDAVIVSTPDHTHAPILLTAMAHNKHVYGQKPLVHQLAELSMVEKALQARPGLVTQVGNQRMASAGRRAAVEILRRNLLGKAIDAHVWVNSPNSRSYFNLDRKVGEPKPAPEGLDWNLWLGPCDEAPYRDGIAPVVWRSWWNYGSNGLGDWGCHVLDVLVLAFDELTAPYSVLTHCPQSTNPEFHSHPCHSSITYLVDSPRFAHRHFTIHYSDSGQEPSRASLGLPPGRFPDKNMTVVTCEKGTLVLTADGRLEIWRDGKVSPGIQLEGLPEFSKINHWHAWVDRCLGRDAILYGEFSDAIRMTEIAQLAVKASRFPGTELLWDRSEARFTNHSEATDTVVHRSYRKGFAPLDVI